MLSAQRLAVWRWSDLCTRRVIMFRLVALIPLLAESTALADPPRAYELAAHVGAANVDMIEDENDHTGWGPAVDLELRTHASEHWLIGAFAGFASGHVQNLTSDLHEQVYDAALRATARTHHVMIGAGLGLELQHEGGYYNGIDGQTDATSKQASPFVELHAGFDLPRIGSFVPEVMATVTLAGGPLPSARFTIGGRL